MTASRLATPERATGRDWAGMVLLLLPMLTLSTDLTVLFFALPTLSADLNPTATQALWIVHVYGFLIAGFLVTMGRLGDRIGPRRLMLLGSGAFAALSVLAAFAVNAEMLIAIRGLLGIAGATLMPSLFSLLRVMFRDDTQRRLAIAIMFSAFSAGGAIGPLLGGALLQFFWWGSVFLINVPPMVLLLMLGRRLLPERRDSASSSLDLMSVAMSVAGMLALVYGLQELAAGQEHGQAFGWPYLLIAAAGVAVLAMFVRRQRCLLDPLFDLRLLTNPRIAASLVTIALVGVAMVGSFYLFTQYLQWVAGLSALQAGLWTLPYIVLNIAGSMSAPKLAARWSPATVIVAGLVVAAIGAAVVPMVISPGGPLLIPAGAMSIMAMGQGASAALVSDVIISSAPEERTGSAAAAQEVSGELGTALGVAAGGAVGMFVYRSWLAGDVSAQVPAAALDRASDSIHEGFSAAAESPAGSGLLETLRGAVAAGLQTYAVVSALLIIAGLLVAGTVLFRRGTDV